MATIEIPKVRKESTIIMYVSLTDNGVTVDWTSLSEIKPFMYSDEQHCIAGKCTAEIVTGSPETLIVRYPTTAPQFLGQNSLLIRCTYDGNEKSFDVPVLEFVDRSSEATGVTVIEDPELPVAIEVQDVDTSVLDDAIAAALDAAAKATAAAELVPLDILAQCQAAAEAAEAAAENCAPVIGDNGNWWIYDYDAGEYVDSGKPSRGIQGEQGIQGIQGIQGNTGSSVDYPYELVNNLTTDDATKGLSAAQGVALKSEVSQLDQKVTGISSSQSAILGVTNLVTFWEVGALSSTTGEDVSNSSCYRSNFIPVTVGKTYKYWGSTGSANSRAILVGYSSASASAATEIYKGTGTQAGSIMREFIPKQGTAYIRISYQSTYTGYYGVWDLSAATDVVSRESELETRVAVLKSSAMNTPKVFELVSVWNGGVAYTDGTITDSSAMRLTDYIPVSKGDKIFFKGAVASSAFAMLAAFSAKDLTTYIKGSSVQGTGNALDIVYTVPEGVNYIRFSQNSSYLTGIYYSIFEPLPAYENGATAKDSVNLFDKDNLLSGYYYNTSSYTAYEGYAMTQPIKVENGVTYKTPHPAAMGSVRRCARCNADGTYISGLDMTESGDFDTVTPAFDGYIRFNVGYENVADTFMVCESSKYPSIYVPFGRTLYDTLVNVSDILGGIVNPLYGKILACDGDSICYGVGYRNGYAKIIAERNNMTYQNLGVAGATLASGTYNGDTARHWISTNVSNLRSDADYIIIEGGVNDSETMGTAAPNDFSGPFDSTTFIGAIDTLCQSLYGRFPGKKIGFIIVHAVNAAWMPGGTKYEAALEGFKKWGIPVCDLVEQCPPFGLLASDDYLKVTYTKDGDGWHPNEAGYKKYYCDKIEAWLRTL